jgi:hypothetical protein
MNARAWHSRLPLAFLLAFLSTAAQQADDPNSAIDRLRALPDSVQQVLNVINQTNFGPFEISGSCGYDRFLWWDNKTWSWWWKFPNYAWLKTDLQVRYGRVKDKSAEFEQHFEPVKTWLLSALPHVTQQMDEAGRRLNEAVRHAPSEGGLPLERATDSATTAQAVERELALLGSQVQASAGQLSLGVRSLSIFNQQLTNLLQQALALKDTRDAMFAADERTMNQEVGNYPCDAATALARYADIRNTVRAQFDGVVNASNRFGVTASETDRALSQILGMVIATQGSIAGVMSNLQAAKITPSGAIQQLRLNVVVAQWRELGDYARQHLGK